MRTTAFLAMVCTALCAADAIIAADSERPSEAEVREQMGRVAAEIAKRKADRAARIEAQRANPGANMKSRAEYQLPQVSYWIAYRILPHYAFEKIEEAKDRWTRTPAEAGIFFYIMASRMGGVEPVPHDARMHTVEHGQLDESHDYYLMSYPIPDPVDSRPEVFLAPHFSVIVQHRDSGEVSYFVLGQAPDGGTTFRTVTANGVNANLGPGPSPSKDAFLDHVRAAAKESDI